jgi:hypothetical protein
MTRVGDRPCAEARMRLLHNTIARSKFAGNLTAGPAKIATIATVHDRIRGARQNSDSERQCVRELGVENSSDKLPEPIAAHGRTRAQSSVSMGLLPVRHWASYSSIPPVAEHPGALDKRCISGDYLACPPRGSSTCLQRGYSASRSRGSLPYRTHCPAWLIPTRPTRFVIRKMHSRRSRQETRRARHELDHLPRRNAPDATGYARHLVESRIPLHQADPVRRELEGRPIVIQYNIIGIITYLFNDVVLIDRQNSVHIEPEPTNDSYLPVRLISHQVIVVDHASPISLYDQKRRASRLDLSGPASNCAARLKKDAAHGAGASNRAAQ